MSEDTDIEDLKPTVEFSSRVIEEWNRCTVEYGNRCFNRCTRREEREEYAYADECLYCKYNKRMEEKE